MEPSRRALTFAIIIAAVALTGCVTEKKVTDNPGFDQVNNLLNETKLNDTVQQEPTTWSGRGVTLAKTMWNIADAVVKEFFGEKGWYLVVVAAIVLIVLAIFKRFGLLVVFLLLMFLFTKVIK